MRLKPSPDREIDLGTDPPTEGLEVIEIEPDQPAPDPPPVRLLADLPAPPEAPYATPVDDTTGTKGIWTAIETLADRRPR